MIEIKNHAEEMVLKIINDAKAKNYKFHEKHSYKVNSDELDLICALLLKLNISVDVKEVIGDICDIEISFVTAKERPKFTYVFRSTDNLIEGEASLKDLELDSNEDLKPEIDTCMPHIIKRLCYTEV